MHIQMNPVNKRGKRGQSISINVIIVAIIALLVLVLVSFVFSSKFAQFSKGVNNCEQFGNTQCSYGSACPEGYIKDITKQCYVGNEVDSSQTCCILTQAE